MKATADKYVLGDYSDEKSRQQALCRVFDDHSKKLLELVPIQPDWKCIDLGGGTGSVAKYIGQQLRPGNKVQVVDLDSSLCDPDPSIEITSADVRELDFDDESFDLIHARLLLTHLREREELLEKFERWLKPGGSLVIEELDYGTGGPLEDESNDGKLINKIARVLKSSFKNAGIEPFFGRKLPLLFQNLGFRQVYAEGFVPIGNGGSDLSDFQRGSMSHLSKLLTSTGEITQEEMDKYISLRTDPKNWVMDFTLVSVAGSKPIKAH